MRIEQWLQSARVVVGWLVFYGILTFVGYLIANSVFLYTCFVSKQFVVYLIFKRVVRTHLRIVTWFQAFQFNIE